MSETLAAPPAPPVDPETPDFDAYVCTERVVAARVESATTIVIEWSDGRVDRHHPWMLRENATDPTTTSPGTRERLADIATWGDDIVPLALTVSADGGVTIEWAPDDLRARYITGWLRHVGSSDWHPDAIRPLPVTWAADAGEPPAYDGPGYLADDTVLHDALDTLGRHGIIRLRGLPLERDVVLAVADRIGVIRATPFGHDFDVVARPDADSQAYTGDRLPPHTDIPTRETEAGLQLLHCLRNDVTGGESIMVDGFRVAEHLRATDPDTFAALTDLRWVWANRSTVTDVRYSAPVIGLRAGAVDEIRFANTLRLFPDMDHADVDRAYRAVREFTRLIDDDRFCIRFAFAPGDCVIFDNRRVLHGREGFSADTGGRHLRGCYVDRDDLYSRLRMLCRARRASVP